VNKEKVYLDSTIPSYFFDDRENLTVFINITRQWWYDESQNYELWISDAVIQEVSEGNYPGQRDIMQFVKKLPLLEPNKDLEQIVDFYIKNYVMPNELIGDAVHLAYTSFYGIDYLLTWNCNHLANANKRKHIRVINGKLGLSTPAIVTPMELFKENNNVHE
jgi:predicted nucleic acid-binding protein